MFNKPNSKQVTTDLPAQALEPASERLILGTDQATCG
jgi:hypothetical protein